MKGSDGGYGYYGYIDSQKKEYERKFPSLNSR